ncbi:hypothetical protein EDD17DRAFT_1762971 [Pisolithus thermaeus]|nr:hypothetical protein EDD17DRAFT_1762971 [Pisolithus thermaeus]
MGQALAGRLLNMRPFFTCSPPCPSNLPLPRLPRRPPPAVVHPRPASLIPDLVDQELDNLEGGVMLRPSFTPSVSAFEFSLRIFALPTIVVLVVTVVAFLLAFSVPVSRLPVLICRHNPAPPDYALDPSMGLCLTPVPFHFI